MMKVKNESDNRYKEFDERPKFNWNLLIFVILGLFGIVMFVPNGGNSGIITQERSYTDVTQVRLMDAVLVEFEWTAEYTLPFNTKSEERARFERHVRQIMNQGINEAVRGCFNSADLYAANTDTIYNSLYALADFERLELKLDTVYITSMEFEAAFMEMIKTLHNKKMMVLVAEQGKLSDSLDFDAYKMREGHKLEAMAIDRLQDSLELEAYKSKLVSKAEIQRAELMMDAERQIANAKRARLAFEEQLRTGKISQEEMDEIIAEKRRLEAKAVAEMKEHKARADSLMKAMEAEKIKLENVEN